MFRSVSSEIVTSCYELISRCSHVEERYIFELLAVIVGLKRVARLHLETNEEFAALQAFAQKNELLCKHASTRAKLAWTNAIGDSFFTAVDWNDPDGKAFAAYISRDPDLLTTISEVEEHGTAYDCGLLLGYPECCCADYSKIENGQYWVSAIADSSPNLTYPFWGNKFAYLLHGASLFPDYFPCCLDCSGTHDLSRNFADVGQSFGLSELVTKYQTAMSLPVLIAAGAIVSGTKMFEWDTSSTREIREAMRAFAASGDHNASFDQLPDGIRVFRFE